jgi:hypothetical protein
MKSVDFSMFFVNAYISSQIPTITIGTKKVISARDMTDKEFKGYSNYEKRNS